MADTETPATQAEPTGEEIEREIGELSAELGKPEPHAAEPASQQKRKRTLDSPWLAGVCLGIAVGLTVFNLTGLDLFGGRTDVPLVHATPDPLRDVLLFAVEEIESFREEHERLPTALDEIGLDEEPGLTYATLGDDGYFLTISEGESSLTFSSTDDPAGFFGSQWAGT